MPRKTLVEDAALLAARKKLGDRLRQRRIDLGFSQYDVASTGTVDRTVLSRIEGGVRTYSVDYLLILDELYNKFEEAKK